MRWIYLSPHLDDAAFSAGGLIYEQAQAGIPVEIWTFMCGYVPEDDVSPFAQMLHTQWGFASAEETTRLRRAEDKNAAAILGADVLHFDFPDCIYRRGADGEWLYWDVTVPPRPEDAEIPSQIASAVSARLKPDDVLVCQLSVGAHVDHVLVRQGAELLGRPLVYDIDIPYIFYKPAELELKTAGMKESVYSITEAGLRSWQAAVLAYKSQLIGLGDAFNTSGTVKESLQAYLAERGGIRLLQMNSQASSLL
ncbi:MAG TPA: PIG-L family deacetylase [Anaerolineales bacterium]|nr:PIG-L family deacetylase [Anaerolineales bacterium]HLO32572.1 PIG-L family deacetylase [Anaerolineales bacterium]